MDKIRLCYGEMPATIQKYLKQQIKNHWEISAGRKLDKITENEAIDDLFNRNNAGIDVDIFPYMTRI